LQAQTIGTLRHRQYTEVAGAREKLFDFLAPAAADLRYQGIAAEWNGGQAGLSSAQKTIGIKWALLGPTAATFR
jgi:hypothetical protein